MRIKAGYDSLMNAVCVGLGYCGCIRDGEPLHVDVFIPQDGLVTADQFVEWVILADNLDPKFVPNAHKRAIGSAFVQAMGGDVADAKALRWSKG